MMIGHKNQRKAAGPITQLLGVDHVDMREYHGHIGDLIRIDAFSLFKLDKVLVAIRAEKAGVIERGPARPDPTTNQWLGAAWPGRKDHSKTGIGRMRFSRTKMSKSRAGSRFWRLNFPRSHHSI